MCGLGGYLGEPARPRPLRAEALTLHHRGPDDQQALHFAAADGTPGLLCFARLSILDLSPRGAQPMQSDDGAHALIYNGEIYNHATLRSELVTAGAQFRSRSDTEVVLRAYGALGVRAFARLRGMFALALWDASRQELLLARDTLGIKPLYYCFDGERLVFASEVRALLAAGAVPPRLEPRAVHGLLSSGAIPEPLTILRDVAALPSGHLLRVAVGRGRVSAPTLERFPPTPCRPIAPAASPVGDPRSARALREKAAKLAPLLRETVGLHLVADVPVALLLSGGVDSTAVAALARAAAPAAQLGSFTLTYGAADSHSEGAAARRTAEALQLAHHDCPLSAAAALAALPQFLAAQDQPSIDGFNTYLISEQVRAAGYKVALSGLGGDELFLGYRLHRLFAAAWLLGDKLPGAALWLAAVAEQLACVWSPPPVGARPSPAGRCNGRPQLLARLWALDPTSPPSQRGAGPRFLHRLLGRSAPAAARLSKAAAVLAAAALPAEERAAALYSRLRSLWSPAEVADLIAPRRAAGSTEEQQPTELEGEERAASSVGMSSAREQQPTELEGEERTAPSVGMSSACEQQPTKTNADAESRGRPRRDRSLRAQLRGAYQLVMQLERRNYLRNTLLRDADVLSMAHGVELRVPLCDAELWRAVEELGPEPTLHAKELLVAAVGEPLCTAAAARRKRGFTLPLHRFLTGALQPLVSAHFADAALIRRAGLTAAATRAWTEYTQTPTERMTYRVWSLFTLLAYVKRHGLEP